MELDSSSTAADSVNSSPRSDHTSHHDGHHLPRVRFMCSSGGKILPRPHDNQLRYVGGDTRIVAVSRSTSFSALLSKLSKLSGINNLTVKYQLPNEDLDALISVTTDEDVENMMEEFDRLSLHNHNPRSARLRLFLFSGGGGGGDADSRSSSISSILDGSSNREQWFFDALNGGGPPHSASGGLERGRSEASSIVSEVPDYLFGLDNSEENLPREPKPKSRHFLQHETVSVSDPGSPAPAVSSPFCSTSSAVAAPLPYLPPVRTKPDIPVPSTHELKEATSDSFLETGETIVAQPPSGFAGSNTMWHYAPNSHYPGPPVQHMPIYYVPGPVPPTTVPVQPMQLRAQYVQPQYAATGQMTQVPMGYQQQQIPSSGQVYGGPLRQASVLDPSFRPVPEGMSQQHVYYGVTNTGMVAGTYPGIVVSSGGEDVHVTGMEAKSGRVSQ